jgi:phosphate/sulfate permease
MVASPLTGMAGNIVAAWVLTIPAAALIAAGCFVAVRPLF